MGSLNSAFTNVWRLWESNCIFFFKKPKQSVKLKASFKVGLRFSGLAGKCWPFQNGGRVDVWQPRLIWRQLRLRLRWVSHNAFRETKTAVNGGARSPQSDSELLSEEHLPFEPALLGCFRLFFDAKMRWNSDDQRLNRMRLKRSRERRRFAGIFRFYWVRWGEMWWSRLLDCHCCVHRRRTFPFLPFPSLPFKRLIFIRMWIKI